MTIVKNIARVMEPELTSNTKLAREDTNRDKEPEGKRILPATVARHIKTGVPSTGPGVMYTPPGKRKIKPGNT